LACSTGWLLLAGLSEDDWWLPDEQRWTIIIDPMSSGHYPYAFIFMMVLNDDDHAMFKQRIFIDNSIR